MTQSDRTYFIPLGTYRRTLDQKMRMTVPGIWREDPLFIRDKGFLAFRRPRRLILLPHDFVQRVLKEKYKKAGNREKEDIRMLLASLYTVVLDSRGRMVVPHEFAKALNISPGDRMVFTASGDWIEIWPMDDWERGPEVKGLFTP
jgi:AbrB family looped-hinge helix DNA binding protein